MGKVEKLSPSPTYSKSGSKRSKMIVKAVRQSDENVTSQNASENIALNMDETVETDRETSETDDNWQTVTNQRSNEVQKTNTHAPTRTMSFLDRRSLRIRKRMEFIHTSLSETMTHELNQPFVNMVLRNLLRVDHRQILKEEERERIYRRSNWNSTLSRNQWKSKYSTSL